MVPLRTRRSSPIGESLSDYEAVGEVAKKLGLYEEFTGGMTVQEKMKLGFDDMELERPHQLGADFQDKKYYIMPTDPEWEKIPAGPARSSTKIPRSNPLETPSGKLEFYSQRLADHFPDDEERAPSPKWIENSA